MRVFSVRQSWHFWVSLLYGAASLWMLHSVVQGMSLFFSSQMWVERAVLWALDSLGVAVGVVTLLEGVGCQADVIFALLERGDCTLVDHI